MDTDVEAELVDHCNCTIYTCWICCNGLDHRRWLDAIACREICHCP